MRVAARDAAGRRGLRVNRFGDRTVALLPGLLVVWSVSGYRQLTFSVLKWGATWAWWRK